MKKTEYYVNCEKKTVVCTITIQDDWMDPIRFEGKAKCSPEDLFNEEIGKEIARLRATNKMKAWVRDRKKELSRGITARINTLIKLKEKMLAGIDRNEGEINTNKALIRELGTAM